MKITRKNYFIKSRGQNVFVQFMYPNQTPASAIIVAHGLRSYYPGFLNMFSMGLVEAGYIAVKFHFVGTGKSDGKFEEKSTAAMLKNLEDVIDFVAGREEVRGIGIMGRSNAGSLAILHGPDSRIKAYALLAPDSYYSLAMAKFVQTAVRQGQYFVHQSFKRPHTKGPGRLPLSYIDELKLFDRPLLKNIKIVKRVMVLQSIKDEATSLEEGHFDYYKKHLPNPKKLLLVDATNHSMGGKKRYVIKEAIRWFKKYLPVK